MSEQNKAISNFNIIRKLVRNLYLEGFNNYLETKSLGKSSRSFANNLNSIKHFLDSRFISSKTNTQKKSNPVIAFDTRNETENPLYVLWKTKNSLASNLSFIFAVMDILEKNPNGIHWFQLTSESNSNRHDCYLSKYTNRGIDKKTVKEKLKILEDNGIIEFFDDGKQIRKADTQKLKNLLSSEEVKQAIQFASETCPIGVIGSFILDNLTTLHTEPLNIPVHYKHHYIFNSIDYEIMYILMESITNKEFCEITTELYSEKKIIPIKVFISSQTGRSYIVFWDCQAEYFYSENLELIIYAELSEGCPNYDTYIKKFAEYEPHVWGVSLKKENKPELEHIDLIINYPTQKEKEYIPARIKKEASIGNIKELNDSESLFTADLFDSNEMVPWIRSFFGRITKIEFPYTKKIIEDVTLMATGKYRETKLELDENKVVESKKSTDEKLSTPLFSSLYSIYHIVTKNLIETFIDNNRIPLTYEKIKEIIKKSLPDDDLGELYYIIHHDSEKSDSTTIFNYSKKKDILSFPIENIPSFPLSTIELRFLAAILNDKRVMLFLDNQKIKELEKELKHIVPLWKKGDIKYFDQNKNGDDFENQNYKSLFQTILYAINHKKCIHLIYGQNNNSDIFTPTHMDYSQKDNKFRLFIKELIFPINLENIKECSITEEKPTKLETTIEYTTLKVEIFDDTTTKHLFNRAIRQFSYFKKTCKKTDQENIYEMSFDYDKNDESEIILKILMFGPNMRVLEPESVVKKIKEKISNQLVLFQIS